MRPVLPPWGGLQVLEPPALYLVSSGPSPESWQENPSRWKMETTGGEGGEADEPGFEFCFSVSHLASSLGVTFIIHKMESVFPV